MKALTEQDWTEALARQQEIEQWAVRTGRIPAQLARWGQPIRCVSDSDVRAFLDSVR